MAINLNTNPYYDDFDETKNFQQILFRPGYSVQARELTQIQSILRDQIAKFGNHIFKHGSVVLPGNSNSDLNICYVKLQTTLTDVTALEGKAIVGGTSKLRGIIRKGLAATLTDPATIYVSYYNVGDAGEKLFIEGEALTVTVDNFVLLVKNSGNPLDLATGGASMAFIAAGVFYVNGSFVSNAQQSIVIGKYTTTPSCHVLLKINESIINSDEDSSLLDPAQGSYNYAAPGADRLKISLTLTTLELGSAIDDNYIEIMRYNEGVLEEHLRYPKYSELEKSLARRTYDESGDYVVSGLKVSAREHKKNGLNGGRYVEGDKDKLVVSASAGKAYVLGYEQELIAPYELVIDKARGVNHLKTIKTDLKPSYGQFFYVTNIITGLPKFLEQTSVTLWNSTGAGPTVIGTANVISIDYYASSPDGTESKVIFKLCLSNVVMTGSNSVASVGKITFTNSDGGAGTFTVLNKLDVTRNNTALFSHGEVITTGAAGRVATVHKFTQTAGELFVYKHTTEAAPTVGDSILGGTSTASGTINSIEILSKGKANNLLVELPTQSTYRVKNSSNASDISYKIYHEATVTLTGAAASWSGSFTVSGDTTIDTPEAGNFIIFRSNGVLLPAGNASVNETGTTVTISSEASGTVRIVCSATKTGAAPKTKNMVSAFLQTPPVSISVNQTAPIALMSADVIRIVSITHSIEGDVTNKYSLDNGQRDYAYLLGSITLKSGTMPAGTLDIKYDYFTHTSGSDYFSVDSYESSNLPNYYESSALIYESKNSGISYDLRDVLDFRSSVGTDGTFTVGSASLSRVVQNDSRLSTSIQNYVGRTDVVVLNKDGRVDIVSGTPASDPKLPTIPTGVLSLATVAVSPYTFNVTDVLIKQQNNRVYTMKDVGKIASRLLSLEEYVLLNETEKFAVNYDVVDAKTGLSRYKSGYLVDTFLDPNIISDIFSPQFKVAYASGVIIPQFEIVEAPMFITAHSGIRFTGTLASLPYTSVVMISQPLSSKITNINPFSVFSWVGKMVMYPSVDIWTEVENLAVITNNVTETKTRTITVRRPYNGPLPPPVWDGTADLSGTNWSNSANVIPWVPMWPTVVLPDVVISDTTTTTTT